MSDLVSAEPEQPTDAPDMAPIAVPTVPYEQFAALDIRIGTITQATHAENADSLLVLTVDFGSETRQIVSGIRASFSDPAVLVGQQAPFVLNLPFRTIRGYESQGMILAGGDADTFSLLQPAAAVPAGTPVH